MNNFKKLEQGQSLFEVVVSLAVISVIIVSLVFLATSSIRNSTFSKNKTLSSRLTQEALEWLRGQRDTSWTDFAANAQASPTYCLQSLEWTNIGACGAQEFVTDTVLKRDLTLTVVSANQIQAEVETSWEDSDGVHITRVVTDFTDWR